MLSLRRFEDSSDAEQNLPGVFVPPFHSSWSRISVSLFKALNLTVVQIILRSMSPSDAELLWKLEMTPPPPLFSVK